MTSQRAREAAAEYYCCPEGSPLADDILMGKADDMKIIQAFARIETEAYQRGLRDAAAICDEVAKGKIWDVGAIEAAERIRDRLPC